MHNIVTSHLDMILCLRCILSDSMWIPFDSWIYQIRHKSISIHSVYTHQSIPWNLTTDDINELPGYSLEEGSDLMPPLHNSTSQNGGKSKLIKNFIRCYTHNYAWLII
jgi:hypothetical protein